VVVAVVDVSRVRNILSQIRRVVTGDVILPEDHNLQTDAIAELANVVEPVGPPPPLSVVSRQQLSLRVRLNNVSNNPENAYTERYTFYGGTTFNPIVKRAIITLVESPSTPPNYTYKCWTGPTRYEPRNCPVSSTIRWMKDGSPLPTRRDIFDSTPGTQSSYWVEAAATPNCPPCDTNYCTYGCTDYGWANPWNLIADVYAAAGTNVEGDVAIRDTVPGPCYGIVTNLDTSLYDFVVDGVVRQFYAWKDSYGDIVAYLPIGFRLHGGETLEIRVKPGMGGGFIEDYKIFQLDYLIT
jgi:hypothetical protein